LKQEPLHDKIKTHRKYYVASLNGSRWMSTAARHKNMAIVNLQIDLNKKWKQLQKEGWIIESFWDNEYE
jgi:hypothetical protein